MNFELFTTSRFSVAKQDRTERMIDGGTYRRQQRIMKPPMWRHQNSCVTSFAFLPRRYILFWFSSIHPSKLENSTYSYTGYNDDDGFKKY